MHELSLAGSILHLVEAAAQREHFGRVKTLRLSAGRLAGVEVHALRFALEAVAPGTCLAGAVVEIEEPSGEGLCLQCGRASAVERRGTTCPHCGSGRLQCRGGDALRIVELLVEDEGTATVGG